MATLITMSSEPMPLVPLSLGFRIRHRMRHTGRLALTMTAYSVKHRTIWPLLLLALALVGAGFVTAVQTVSPALYAIF